MTFNGIRALLDSRLALLSSSVAWPGVVFTPPDGSIWYKPSLITSGVDSALGATGSTHPYGTYQVSVFAPAGSGAGALYAAADAVVAHFDRQGLSNVKCGVPTIGPLLEEADWLHLPVSVPFSCL